MLCKIEKTFSTWGVWFSNRLVYWASLMKSTHPLCSIWFTLPQIVYGFLCRSNGLLYLAEKLSKIFRRGFWFSMEYLNRKRPLSLYIDHHCINTNSSPAHKGNHTHTHADVSAMLVTSSASAAFVLCPDLHTLSISIHDENRPVYLIMITV